MTESTSASVLLPTPARKTSRPASNSLSVPRRRLIDHLRREQRPLTLIQGAAGAGKTELAAQWARALGNPIAWVTLDATDNDPVVLISSVMDALHRAGLDGSWDAKPLTSDEPAYSRYVVPNFQIRVDSQARPFTLVLDDAHELTDARAIWLLRCALDSLTSDSHGIVAGRSLASLPVVSWLAAERAALVADEELAMDPPEVTQLLTAVLGGPPSASAVAELHQATHGWPIAVYLGSRLEDPTGIANLTHFSDFLDQEVLRGADDGMVQLLKSTAGLLDLSAELCDYVLESQGSAEILEHAERASLLITRSRDHTWFRLHPLLREHLQARLVAENPALYRSVARRASEWSLAKRQTDRAITYARASGDVGLLGVSIWEGALRALPSGQTQRVADWLDTVDDETIAGSPHLALTATWCSISRGRPADVHRWSLAALDTAGDGWKTNLHRSTLAVGTALLLSTNGALSYESSAALADEAMRSLPADHVLKPYAQMLTGWMQVLGGAWAEGVENLDRSAKLAHSLGVLGTEVEAEGLLSMALLSKGDVQGADRLALRALNAWEEEGVSHFLAAGALIAGPAALVTARSGQHERARSHLAQAREAAAGFGPILTWLAVTVEALAAASHALLGDQSQAGHHLAVARENLADAALDSPLLTDLLQYARQTVEEEFHLSELSPAERRVFDRLLTRATLREIADSLFVSTETVKSQTGSIYRKLGVSSRREVQELGDRLRLMPVQVGR